MAEDLLKVGNKIELTRKRGNGVLTVDKNNYVSQILDVNDSRTIIAAMPIIEGHVVPLEVGSIMEAFFYTGHGIYKANCRVAKRGRDGNIHVMMLALTTELKKFQRRQYFRLQCSIEALVRPLSQEEASIFMKTHELPFINKYAWSVHDDVPVEYITEEVASKNSVLPDGMQEGEKIGFSADSNAVENGMIVDISGGGARLMTESKFQEDTYVLLRFPIELNIGVRHVELVGKVVMSLESPNRRNYFDNRIQFKNIKAEQRDLLVKYIFEQQRKIQQRERG